VREKEGKEARVIRVRPRGSGGTRGQEKRIARDRGIKGRRNDQKETTPWKRTARRKMKREGKGEGRRQRQNKRKGIRKQQRNGKV